MAVEARYVPMAHLCGYTLPGPRAHVVREEQQRGAPASACQPGIETPAPLATPLPMPPSRSRPLIPAPYQMRYITSYAYAEGVDPPQVGPPGSSAPHAVARGRKRSAGSVRGCGALRAQERDPPSA